MECSAPETLDANGKKKPVYKVFKSMQELSLGYESPKFIDYPPPNYTPPGSPSFVDVFKGDDGDNFLFKAYLMSKHALVVTAFMSFGDIVIGTQPKDLTGAMRRVIYWGAPLIGGGLAYTSIVCTAASLRKKNDQWNHAFGGMAAGAVFGAARKSVTFGILTGAAAAFAGVFYKESVLYGLELFPKPRNTKRGWSFSHKMDYTLRGDIPGNWYTDPTPMPGAPVPPACK